MEACTLTRTLTEALPTSLAEPWRLSLSTPPPTVEVEGASEECRMVAESTFPLRLTSLRRAVGVEEDEEVLGVDGDSRRRVEEAPVLRL